jgi:hypothetical protein
MLVDCISIDAPLAYFTCAGIKDVETRPTRTDVPRRLFVQAGGGYGAVREWMICDELPLPVYNDFVALISNRNPGKEGRFWEIGPDGKARLRPGIDLDFSGLLEYAFVEFLRRKARAGKPLWQSQAVVGRVEVAEIVADHPSAWAEDGRWKWVLSHPRLFEEPVPGIRGRPGVFKAELPDDTPLGPYERH